MRIDEAPAEQRAACTRPVGHASIRQAIEGGLSGKNDLAAAMPAKAEELRTILRNWRRRVGRSVPDPAFGR